MSLLFSLLREDHIVFAADSRHVRGSSDGRYLNDNCCKVEPVLGREGLLGFAGHDICEEIVANLKSDGALERGPLQRMAEKIREKGGMTHNEAFSEEQRFQPNMGVEFILTGFEKDQHNDKLVATCYRIGSPFWPILPRSYDPGYDNFDIIGKRLHGAMYAFRKCATKALSLEAGLRLAYFTLMEVSQYDLSVGGPAQLYVLRPDQVFENYTAKMEAYQTWVTGIGEQISKLILKPTSDS